MIFGNVCSIGGILKNLGAGNAISILLGVANIIVSGGIIYLLGSWFCDTTSAEKRKNLVKGLFVNIFQSVLNMIVMIWFATQYGQQIIDATTATATAACDASPEIEDCQTY